MPMFCMSYLVMYIHGAFVYVHAYVQYTVRACAHQEYIFSLTVGCTCELRTEADSALEYPVLYFY